MKRTRTASISSRVLLSIINLESSNALLLSVSFKRISVSPQAILEIVSISFTLSVFNSVASDLKSTQLFFNANGKTREEDSGSRSSWSDKTLMFIISPLNQDRNEAIT